LPKPLLARALILALPLVAAAEVVVVMPLR